MSAVNHIPTAERPVAAAPGFVLCEDGHGLPAYGADASVYFGVDMAAPGSSDVSVKADGSADAR